MFPFPLPLLELYAIGIYFIWWAISRFALLAAWMFARPGKIKFRHWIFILLSTLPLSLEILSTFISVFALGTFDEPANRSFADDR